MSKITRQTQTIFGGTGTTSDFGEFGSLAAGTPTTTKSISLIQSLPAWLGGWAQATIGTLIPAYQDMNSVHYCAFYQICYLLQMGLAEYDSGTTYYTYSIVQYNGVWYQSLIDSNVGNEPDSNPSDWLCVSSFSFGGNVASTSSMTLPNLGNSFKVTGTTTINNITAQPAGISVLLIFTGSLIVNTGGNILLNSGIFATAENYTLMLLSDGTNWYELSRNPVPVPFSSFQENVTSSRALNTVYQNTTGKTLFINIFMSVANPDEGLVFFVYSDSNPSPSTLIDEGLSIINASQGKVVFMVLPGNYYNVASEGAGTFVSWVETY